MRKLLLVAACLVGGFALWAQGDTLSVNDRMLWRSDVTFSDLEGFENIAILNTQPRMIVLQRPGQTMMCPMPDSAAPDHAQVCWSIGD